MRGSLVVPPILVVPGYRGSEADHWQTILERKLAVARRVEMPSWTEPRREEWVHALDAAVARCARPPVLVAHSLGCIAVAHWAAATRRPVAAALLVAPCDVDRPGAAGALRDFAPLPRKKLDFPSLIAASTDDPYLEVERARAHQCRFGLRAVVRGRGAAGRAAVPDSFVAPFSSNDAAASPRRAAASARAGCGD